MTRLTIEVPDDVAERVAEAAAERGVASEALVGQVVAESFPARRQLSFTGMGRSGRSDTAERHKETIREAFADKTAADV
jgi:predicted transcriptional regulator